MSHSLRSLLRVFGLAAAGIGSVCVAQEPGGEDGKWGGKTVVVSVSDGDFEDGRRVREFGRLLDKVSEDGATALVFRIDTRQAADWDLQQRIVDAAAGVRVTKIAFVDSSAIGPGALLALASENIYMAPGGLIGAAGLQFDSGGNEDEDEENGKAADRKRQESILKALARSLARTNGHRTEVAEAFIDGQVEVKIGDEVISKPGEILTLTAEEASREYEGKPLLSAGTVVSLDELLQMRELPGDPIYTSPRLFGEDHIRDRFSRRTGDHEGKATDEAESAESGIEKKDPLFGKRVESSYEDKVVVIRIGQDTLATGDASFEFIDRTLKKAELDGAEAVIFDMDTPGGYSWYTEGLVLNSLQNMTIPTITFVNSRAESAGAIIAVGTDHIYMRPAATIGSALVVSATGADLNESMNDKVTQMMIGNVRNIAELKGHNPDVAEAFVTRNKQVKIDGIVIHEAGNVLNLNTIEATEVIGGRPVLAKGAARSLEEVIDREGIEGEIVEATPLGLEAFAHWVQKLSFLLIIVGLGGAYLEINSPGFGLPGLISVCAFSLFFFGNYLAGNLAGYELAVLFVLGIILIVVEVFVFPGAIIPGAVGGALVLISLGLAMVDRIDLEWKWTGLPSEQSWFDIFRTAFWSLAIGMAGALAAILGGMKFLPRSKFASRLILHQSVAGGASINTGSEEENRASYVGLEGETRTDLLPSGKGYFDGKLLDIVSDGEFIGKGEAVRVSRHEGSRIVVEKMA